MILIVDDEKWFIKPLKDALEESGFEIQSATTPDECMAMVKSGKRVDAVVLDVMLPAGSLNMAEVNNGIDTGLMLLREIRRTCPHIPIILHSVRRDFPISRMRDPMTFILPKSDTTLAEMVRSLRKIVEEGTKEKGSPSDGYVR